MKGNVIDLAVAVIIGGAFKPVISSMVEDVIMPPIGMALGGVNFTNLKFRPVAKSKIECNQVIKKIQNQGFW